jgi:ribosomal protein S18 acetylase RimI-like enzyme
MNIRRATADDAEFLAWTTLSASRSHLPRGVWDFFIGADERGCLDYLRRLAIAEPRSLCHWDAFRVAEVDGEPAAALCGFEFRAGGWLIVAQAMASVQRDLGWTEADLAAARERVAAIWACFAPDVGADWGIENVATRPEYRRRGLSGLLLGEMLREGRERSRKLAQITAFIGNDDAISVYQKAGFRFADEKRCPDMETVLKTPGFFRFLQEI